MWKAISSKPRAFPAVLLVASAAILYGAAVFGAEQQQPPSGDEKAEKKKAVIPEDSLEWGKRAVLITRGKQSGEKRSATIIGSLSSMSAKTLTIKLPFGRGDLTIPLNQIEILEFANPKARVNMLDLLAHEIMRGHKELEQADTSAKKREKMRSLERELLESKNTSDCLSALVRMGVFSNPEGRNSGRFLFRLKFLLTRIKDPEQSKRIQNLMHKMNSEVYEASIREILRKLASLTDKER